MRDKARGQSSPFSLHAFIIHVKGKIIWVGCYRGHTTNPELARLHARMSAHTHARTHPIPSKAIVTKTRKAKDIASLHLESSCPLRMTASDLAWEGQRDTECNDITSCVFPPRHYQREAQRRSGSAIATHFPEHLQHFVSECSVNAQAEKTRVHGNYTYSTIKCRNNIIFTKPKASKGLKRPVRKIRRFTRTGSLPVLQRVSFILGKRGKTAKGYCFALKKKQMHKKQQDSFPQRL